MPSLSNIALMIRRRALLDITDRLRIESALLNASVVLMSGFGAPFLTARPAGMRDGRRGSRHELALLCQIVGGAS